MLRSVSKQRSDVDNFFEVLCISSNNWLKAIALILSVLVFSCSPPDNNTSGEGDGEGSSDNADGDGSIGGGSLSDIQTYSIAYLKSIYNNYPYHITQDIAIEGVVTANNAYGEFPYSLIVEDRSGAIQIDYDTDDVNCVSLGMIVGSTVKVICSGLWIGSVGGMLSVGDAPQDNYPTTKISAQKFNINVRLCDAESIIPIPETITIGELTTDHILKYVYVQNLRVVWGDDSHTTFCSRNAQSGHTEYTEHTLVDPKGDTITLSVSSSVRYADDTLPTDLFSVWAIVEYFNGEYRLRIVNCAYQ